MVLWILDGHHRRIVKDGTGYPVLGCACIAVTGSNGIAPLIEKRLLLNSNM